MLDLDLGRFHDPGFRPFMIRGESSAYWTVFDGAYEPVAVADAYLRRVRFSSGKALGTTRVYASNLALFSAFCLASGRSLRRAALEFDRFVHEIDRVGFLIGRIREAMGELAPEERAELQGNYSRPSAPTAQRSSSGCRAATS